VRIALVSAFDTPDGTEEAPLMRCGLAPNLLLVSFVLGVSAASADEAASVIAAPAPAGEPLSTEFTVQVEKTPVAVYPARVCSMTPEQRQKLSTQASIAQTALTSFASFDFTGTVQVTVSAQEPVTAVTVLPLSAGIHPVITGNTVTFPLSHPGQFTVEINGHWIDSLHLFANPVETNVPDPHDPNVIYFGPGVHHVQSVKATSGQTIYVAAGAVVYGEAGPVNPRETIIDLQGNGVTLRGRGIIDGSLCPRETRSLFGATGTNLTVEGVILRDSSEFTLCPRRSDNMKIENVKIFGWRSNSDGMDICNCRHVQISHCFVRTFDDLIVLKTDKGQGELRDVTVTGCVLWNEFAHALSLGAELREPLSDVHFSDCDIIHDKGREWLLRIYNCDSAPVTNVTFDHIRADEARRLMSVWIGTAVWSKQPERGHADHIVFSNITFPEPTGRQPWTELIGFDAAHAVHDVTFQNVVIGGQPLKLADIQQNAFVTDVKVVP